MKFNTTVDSRQTLDAFAFSEKQTPYIAATMLTKLAADAALAFQTEMPKVFSGPTNFTLRGVYTRGATRASLESFVYIPDSVDEHGKSKREYIRPGAFGASSRRQKRTEYLLTRMGALPAGWVTTPGKGAKLDGNGNLAGSVYKQIINVLQIRGDAKPVSQRSQKGAVKLGVSALFFVVPPGPNKRSKNGGWLPPGVWKHLPGGQITQILKAVKKATYRSRLDIDRLSAEAVQANLLKRWSESARLIGERFARAKGR
jgi:hypothetical protein